MKDDELRLTPGEFFECAKSYLGDTPAEEAASPWEFGIKVMEKTIVKVRQHFEQEKAEAVKQVLNVMMGKIILESFIRNKVDTVDKKIKPFRKVDKPVEWWQALTIDKEGYEKPY